MDFPLVSIVIATYKSRHDHLGMALRSAIGQTWPQLEVVVTDDSPDDSLDEFVASFGDARLRYRRNAPPLGAAMNHWAAFRECHGEFIVVLNHDDSLEPTFVELLARPLIERPKVSLAFCDHWLMDESGKRLPSETQQNSARWGRASLAAGLHQPFSALVVNQTIPLAMAPSGGCELVQTAAATTVAATTLENYTRGLSAVQNFYAMLENPLELSPQQTFRIDIGGCAGMIAESQFTCFLKGTLTRPVVG